MLLERLGCLLHSVAHCIPHTLSQYVSIVELPDDGRRPSITDSGCLQPFIRQNMYMKTIEVPDPPFKNVVHPTIRGGRAFPTTDKMWCGCLLPNGVDLQIVDCLDCFVSYLFSETSLVQTLLFVRLLFLGSKIRSSGRLFFQDISPRGLCQKI